MFRRPLHHTPFLPADVQARVALAQGIARLALKAGREVMHVYRAVAEAQVTYKSDASPVTQADERAEACILAGLAALTPGLPVVAEEAMSRAGMAGILGGAASDTAVNTAPGSPSFNRHGDVFWLVDPLDGTREFIARNGEFTVNIALVENGEPVLGVVLAPALPQGPVLYLGVAGQGAWRAVWTPGLREGRGEQGAAADVLVDASVPAPGQGAPWQPIAARSAPRHGITVVGSRSHGDDLAMQAFIASRAGSPPVVDHRGIGSSLKFCLLAEGQADLYPRLGRTMEWDTAAGQAVLQAAGGQVLTLEGQPLRYGKPGFENPHFVAQGAQ